MNTTTKTRTALKQQYLSIVEKDEALIGLIAKATGRSFQSIKLWIKANDEKLTMFSSLAAIREYLKLAKSVVLTEDIEA